MVRRASALVLAIVVAAVATLSWSLAPATAAPAGAGVPALAAPAAGVPALAPGGLCSTEEWQGNFRDCVNRLNKVAADRADCLDAPTPSAPDSGLAGWFAERPASSSKPGPQGIYSEYGYAGYNFSTYGLGCASTLTQVDAKFENTVANGEFMIATAIIGASNALRERAWDPAELWGWADPLVDEATKAIYQKVFSVFGVLTLGVVGLYLLWRSRQADMGSATTTAGWAILVMVGVTAIAAWPVHSANLADRTLTTTLGVVHDAIGPRALDTPSGKCDDPTPGACDDNRPPAVRASDTATDTMLYRNWLRGVLGSADSDTALKYGRALYDARSLSWEEAERLRTNPSDRDATLQAKKEQWNTIAEQIKTEDPEAYEYLQGVNGMDRVGSGFIAMLAAAMFAMFDLTASLLVLLGFLIFRWAVIAAPILGTIGLMRPASAGLRRLGNAVVAAVFNIAIFGTGAAIYLFAVDLIMHTGSLPGWLQVVLVWLCGIVGWLLLRPYRRITQLGGKDNTAAVGSAGSWHRRFFRDMREAAKLDPATPGGTREPTFGKGRQVYVEQTTLRPEARLEDPAHSRTGRLTADEAEQTRPDSPSARPDGVESTDGSPAPAEHRPIRRRAAEWTEPDVAERPASYAIYRPETATTPEQATPRVRSEAR
ncbi:MAG TPA: MFS transporter [Actinoplanes sp.]|nr:MFS transporter [Actinoplanes sp.]